MCFIIFIRIFEMKKHVKAFEALSKVFRRSKKKFFNLVDWVRDSAQKKSFVMMFLMSLFLMSKEHWLHESRTIASKEDSYQVESEVSTQSVWGEQRVSGLPSLVGDDWIVRYRERTRERTRAR